MSAVINWDFAVQRWADTMLEISYSQGKAEVERRTEGLPKAFERRVVLEIKGEPNSGPY